jgi:hypothetical protein
VAIYSAGTGGGNDLKFAVKLPNFVIGKIDSGLSGFIWKKSKIESQTDGPDAICYNCVELPFKFCCQLTNSNPWLGLAVHLVPEYK